MPSSIHSILDYGDLNSKVFSLILKETESQCIDFKSEVIVTPAYIVTGIVEYAEKNDAWQRCLWRHYMLLLSGIDY